MPILRGGSGYSNRGAILELQREARHDAPDPPATIFSFSL
jgi:hypothetical protein